MARRLAQLADAFGFDAGDLIDARAAADLFKSAVAEIAEQDVGFAIAGDEQVGRAAVAENVLRDDPDRRRDIDTVEQDSGRLVGAVGAAVGAVVGGVAVKAKNLPGEED